MNKSWIHEQTEVNISQFDKAMEVSSPEAGTYIRDPKKYLSRISEQCNYLDAVKLIDWKSCLSKDCSVLDLGCGGWWLTGYLSKLESVSTVYALDSSKYFLLKMMPKIVMLMGGTAGKDRADRGLVYSIDVRRWSIRRCCRIISPSPCRQFGGGVKGNKASAEGRWSTGYLE